MTATAALTAREALATALDARTAAQTRVDAAEQARGNALQLLAGTQAELDRVEQECARAASAAAQLVAEAIKRGQTAEIPPAADDRLALLRSEAQRKRTVAGATLATLEADLAGARAELEAAQASVTEAIRAVLLEEAKDLERHFATTLSEAYQSRALLLALADSQLNGRFVIDVSGPKYAVLHRGFEALDMAVPKAANPGAKLQAAWDNHIKTLGFDAQATLGF